MITVFDLDGPLHPPFEPVVVLRTEILGVLIVVTLTTPHTATTRAVGRRLGPERVSSEAWDYGTATTRTRNVELVDLVASEAVWFDAELPEQFHRTARDCAERVNSQIAPGNAVPVGVVAGLVRFEMSS